MKERSTPEGRRLCALRKELGLTMSAAAARWGMSEQMLSRYEMGCELVKSKTAIRIAELEGVSLDWLFARTETRATA